MKTICLLFCSFLLLIVAVFSGGCKGKGDAPDSRKHPSNQKKARPQTSQTSPVSPATGSEEVCETALVFIEKPIIYLRPAGSSTFDPISDQIGFFRGDILKVGDGGRALAYCIGTGSGCYYPAGTYDSCCGSCQDPFELRPETSSERVMFMSKQELPQTALLELNEQEQRIDALGVDQTTKSMLLSDLYTNWKLKEAAPQLDSLSQQLAHPDAKSKLKKLYAPFALGTGNLYLKNGNEAKAEQNFRRAVEFSTVINDPEREADAHRIIGKFYMEKGSKQKAIENLQSAESLYEKAGQTRKADGMRRNIVSVRTMKFATQQKNISVPANILWVDTGLTVEKERHLKIQATGMWSNVGPPSIGPDGFANTIYPGTVLATANLGALIARVGDTMFLVGATFDGPSPASGELFLAINDTPDTYGDNQGSLQVQIQP
jgi:tetratricopeptide (TPR) repeat protein